VWLARMFRRRIGTKKKEKSRLRPAVYTPVFSGLTPALDQCAIDIFLRVPLIIPSRPTKH